MKLQESLRMDPQTEKNVKSWLEGQYDADTKAEIKRLMRESPEKLVDAFFANLSFGTAGMRGIMGVGSNRLNVYTVRAATQGLANYIRKQPKDPAAHGVFIGYDSRHHSREFAEEAAKVLAGNGIRVYLFKNIRPTPLVSFGCRFKHCISAIMITASHNPPEYNGYKVYWSDGGQVVPPHDTGIIAEVEKITDPSMVKKADALSNSLIEEVEEEIDAAYVKAVNTLQHYPEINKKEGSTLKVVYTSLHGTGITMVPKTLATWGFTNLALVEKQVIPDGDFPTAHSPNPEELAALKLGLEQMQQTQSDILIANDPDADRMGVAFMHQGKPVVLNGNQIAAICLEHVCEALTSQKKMPAKAGFIKSIGTTELFQAICDAYSKPCFNVLTGFKYIAEKILSWENEANGYQYIFGGEESYGYLLGTYTRDKDAVVASALMCEIALQAKRRGKTLLDNLHDIYRRYGVYEEKLASIVFPDTKEGRELMTSNMHKLREAPWKEVNSVPVVVFEDYQRSTHLDLKSGKTTSLTLPVSDILLYWLADGSKVMIRPSGTEPKVKVYSGVVERKFDSIAAGVETCTKRADALLAFVKKQLAS